MRHEMLTQRAPFCDGKKGHAESAFRDACRTSSSNSDTSAQLKSPTPADISRTRRITTGEKVSWCPC